jgi:diguanylate cyclase (GGDEF)-like protein
MQAPPLVEPADQIDHRTLRERVFAERVHQYMTRERMTAASGPLASAYQALLLWGDVEPLRLLAWWLAVFMVDLSTLLHTTRYLRQPPGPAQQGRWLNRQVALQALAGLVWGGSVALMVHDGQLRLVPDSALVLVTVNSIAVIGMLPFRHAVLAWTSAVWTLPMALLLAHPTPHHLTLALGVVVLMLSLNFYLWTASRHLVEGIEKRFEADALAQALRSAAERIQELATRDELTGAYNRRQGMKLLNDWLAQPNSRRSDPAEACLGLLLVDVDHFKRVNDSLGHPAGDRVLRAVAERLQQQLRDADALARIGGEEFMVLLPAIPRETLLPLAERLRLAVAAEPIAAGGQVLSVHISVGAVAMRIGDSTARALAQADAALYRSKHQGRNRVTLADPPGPPDAATPATTSG